jgi:hypothetical protein
MSQLVEKNGNATAWLRGFTCVVMLLVQPAILWAQSARTGPEAPIEYLGKAAPEIVARSLTEASGAQAVNAIFPIFEMPLGSPDSRTAAGSAIGAQHQLSSGSQQLWLT